MNNYFEDDKRGLGEAVGIILLFVIIGLGVTFLIGMMSAILFNHVFETSYTYTQGWAAYLLLLIIVSPLKGVISDSTS